MYFVPWDRVSGELKKKKQKTTRNNKQHRVALLGQIISVVSSGGNMYTKDLANCCPSQASWTQCDVFSPERTTLKLQEQFVRSVYPAGISPALLAGLQLTHLGHLGEER